MNEADHIHELNDAVGSNDFQRFTDLMQPDAVWEHNPGSGSPEEGEYHGRARIRRLFERIYEGWEYMRPVATEIREIEPGVYFIRGELHSKHAATQNEIVSPYEQRLEIRDGLMARCRMTIGTTVGADSPQVAAVRRFAEAFNRRDLDMIVADLDPEVELDEWQEAPGARTYRGPDGVQAAVDSWFETWEWMHVEVEDVREVGERVLFGLHQRARGSGSGIEVETRSWNVYSFRDGRVIRIQLFLEPEPALEAAGLTPNYEKEKR